ncbi:hypothetical protein ACQKLX_09995 [Bosea sp. NPDC003192]|uniref:hypothetical protein n=1 Tax=Bosea sp. NPDC003192 TaxID=3390551 RepID=UPI003D04691D
MTDHITDAELVEVDDDDFLKHVRTVGIRAAYDAALAMVRDPKTPAGARVTAARWIADIAGYLGGAGDEGASKELHEMTGDELRAHTTKLEAQAAAMRQGMAGRKSASASVSVFD